MKTENQIKVFIGNPLLAEAIEYDFMFMNKESRPADIQAALKQVANRVKLLKRITGFEVQETTQADLKSAYRIIRGTYAFGPPSP